MRLVLHIFKKDARHLWPHTLVTLVILAALGQQDRWRADWLASQTEGWLNLLLPLAWAFLIGLAVEQEPLAGHRQFWITRPYRRSGLLASKVLFAVAFVHLPFFVEQSYVMAARGFSPAAYLPELLWNQVLLGAALTLPSLALAALASTFTQFVMEIVVASVAIVFLRSTFDSARVPWENVDTVRVGATIVIVATASIAVACLQYFGRRVLLSRGVGVAAGIAAGAIFAILLPPSALALKSALAPIHSPLTLAIRQEGGLRAPTWWPANRVTVAIPVRIGGMPAGALYHVEMLGSEVAGDGVRYSAATRASYQSFQKVPFENSYLTPADDRPGEGWLFTRFDRAVYDRLKNTSVEISGEAGIAAYRLGATTWMSTESPAYTPQNGRCSSTVLDDRYSEGMLKVECESPSAMPLPTWVRLWHPETGRDWTEKIGSSAPFAGGPRSTWLEALDRRQMFFRLADTPRKLDSPFYVPRTALATARIAITPEIVTGYSVLKYDIKGVTLSKYFVQPLR